MSHDIDNWQEGLTQLAAKLRRDEQIPSGGVSFLLRARDKIAELRAQLQAANDVAAHYREQLAAEAWRPASEVPPVGFDVLCRTAWGTYCIVRVPLAPKEEWYKHCQLKSITHWRPIAPPGSEAKQ